MFLASPVYLPRGSLKEESLGIYPIQISQHFCYYEL